MDDSLTKDIQEPPDTSDRTVSGGNIALAVGLILTVIVVLALRFHVLPLGIPGEWEWLYREVPVRMGFGTLLALMTCLLAAALVAWLLNRQTLERYQTRLALAVMVLACWVSVSGLLVDRPAAPVEVPAVSTSVTSMGYYSFAKATPELWRAFSYFSGHPQSEHGLPTPPGRVATHPPGPFLFFYYGRALLQAWPAPARWLQAALLNRWGLTDDILYSVARFYAMPNIGPNDMIPAAVLALVVTFLGCLLPLPAYLLGRELMGREAGLVTALVAATIPSLLAFSPSIDGVAAVLACLTMALAVRALRRGQWLACILAGVALSAGVLWTAGLGVIVVAMIVLAAVMQLKLAREEGRLSPALALLAVFGTAGLLLLALKFAVGYDVLGNLRLISINQRNEMLGRRQYTGWLPMNLYDFALFMGPFAAALVAAAYLRLREVSALWGYGLGVAAMLLMVVLSGSTRGEVGRIWLFMMPLFGVLAAAMLVSVNKRDRTMAILLTVICQFGLGFTISSCLALVNP